MRSLPRNVTRGGAGPRDAREGQDLPSSPPTQGPHRSLRMTVEDAAHNRSLAGQAPAVEYYSNSFSNSGGWMIIRFTDRKHGLREVMLSSVET